MRCPINTIMSIRHSSAIFNYRQPLFKRFQYDMNKTEITREKLERLHLRYAAQLPLALSTVEEGWKKVLDEHWDKVSLGQLLQVIHRISGSSASYG